MLILWIHLRGCGEKGQLVSAYYSFNFTEVQGTLSEIFFSCYKETDRRVHPQKYTYGLPTSKRYCMRIYKGIL